MKLYGNSNPVVVFIIFIFQILLIKKIINQWKYFEYNILYSTLVSTAVPKNIKLVHERYCFKEEMIERLVSISVICPLFPIETDLLILRQDKMYWRVSTVALQTFEKVFNVILTNYPCIYYNNMKYNMLESEC